jgi:hypothetical protein
MELVATRCNLALVTGARRETGILTVNWLLAPRKSIGRLSGMYSASGTACVLANAVAENTTIHEQANKIHLFMLFTTP